MIGPALFFRLSDLRPGDRIELDGEDRLTYRYEVLWVRTYAHATAPIQEILEGTDMPSLTLITDAPPWFDAADKYLNVTVVRAVRTSPPCWRLPAWLGCLPAAAPEPPDRRTADALGRAAHSPAR